MDAGEQHQRVAAAACERCAGPVEWEAIDDGDEERWLGTCRECAWMMAFLPEGPTCAPRDPLRTYLLGAGAPLRPQSPPWIRLFRLAAALPWLEWFHAPGSCAACGTHVTFRANGNPRPSVLADCRLCLSCGLVSVEHVRPGSSLHEAPVVGDVWSPPCPAVARLRQAVLRPYWRDHWPPERD